MRGSSGLEIALCGADGPAHLVPMELEPNLLGASTKRCKHRMAGPHTVKERVGLGMSMNVRQLFTADNPHGATLLHAVCPSQQC